MATTTPIRAEPAGALPALPPRRPKTFRLRDGLVLAASLGSSLALVWLLYERLLPVNGAQGFVLCWAGTFLLMYWLAVRELEGPMMARDRLAAASVTVAAIAVIVPLATILGYTAVKGAKFLTLHFFTQTLEFTGPEDPPTAGGGLQAIVGTIEQVGIAMLISVPLGILTAVFLNEVGGRMRRPTRVFVDAMSGVPSIVAGLFIYTVLIIQLGWSFSGFAAALALSILMLPTVTRTAEVVLRLVPGGLREASLALGAPQWRTVRSVVLPTARVGLITAVILGIARVVGETAPLIMTAFGSSTLNPNPFSGPQASLPLTSFQLIQQASSQNQVDRAWLFAFVLVVLVLVLFVVARILGRPRTAGSKRPRLGSPAPEKEKTA